MIAQLTLFDPPGAPIEAPPRTWVICRHAEPILPDWYEVQTKWRTALPDEWKNPDGYNRFMSPVYWNGKQWCLADDDQRPSPKGSTYPGSLDDRWRPFSPSFDPAQHKQAMRMEKVLTWPENA